MEKISVVIITSNEENNIGRCIDSVLTIADEILVLDSNSTDNTASIAKGRGARVILEPFSGYIDQKNKAVKLATYDFVLSLDADEALDAKLTDAILLQKQKFSHRAYRMNRCTVTVASLSGMEAGTPTQKHVFLIEK
jgi:glycosyltransferase involved in cell wall biosynthesis